MDIDKTNELPQRKELRLKQYDYSSSGAYFITVCIKDRQPILSEIIKSSVGVGALDDQFIDVCSNFKVSLSNIGKIVEKHLLSSENISGVTIDEYVIMPDHIHVIIRLEPEKYIKSSNGSSRAPTPTNEMLPHIISTFKRFCNKEIGYNIFQRGYIEHIIRDRKDYETRTKYIYENPIRWYYKKLNNEQ